MLYDDLYNVGIAQLDASGAIKAAHLFGPLLEDNITIRSGDLLSDGKLILALSNNELALIDVELSLKNKKWEYTKFASTLTNIVWLSPIPNKPEQILIKSINKISLFDLNTKSEISSFLITDYTIEKYSKNFDPHVLVRSNVQSQQFGPP